MQKIGRYSECVYRYIFFSIDYTTGVGKEYVMALIGGYKALYSLLKNYQSAS